MPKLAGGFGAMPSAGNIVYVKDRRDRYLQMWKGTYRVRVPVAKNLRPYLPAPFTGRCELLRTTCTGNLNEAYRIAQPIITAFLKLIAQAEDAADGGNQAERRAHLEALTRPLALDRLLGAQLDEFERRLLPLLRAMQGFEADDAPEPMKLADCKVAPYQDVIEDFAKRHGKAAKRPDGKYADKGIGRKCTVMGEVAEFVGHDDMNRMSTAELDSFFADLVERGTSRQTIRDIYIHVNALFGWAAMGKRHIDSNPMDEIEPQGAQSKNKGVIFYPEQRDAILRAAATSDDPCIKWCNLLAGYMGRELGAIVEARTFDFSQLRDGTWVFDIREDADRSLKTDEREGKLPLPLPVLRAGFPEFLAWVRRTYGEGPLFAMVRSGCRRDPMLGSMYWPHRSAKPSLGVVKAGCTMRTSSGHRPSGMFSVMRHEKAPSAIARISGAPTNPMMSDGGLTNS